MAGGLGTRLRPLTETLPKPMLRVGGRPMLEIILDNFVSQGFKNFFISINYLGHIIQEHFGDGSKFGVSITYLSESKRLGTAGALSLLPEGITENIVVTNGDVLTRLNLRALLDFHNALHSSATICVREFSTQVPYGVVEVADQVVQKIEEKPNVQRLVNAGIYVLNPKLLSQIPKDTYIDMPDLLNSMLKKDQVIGAFPIREYWADIGRVTDLDNANLEFNPSGVEF
jgi:NDP-sugar pyrophosphorylase family protein